MLVVTAGVFASRCFGLARDTVFAVVWGTSAPLAAFLTAFTIPNLFRALLGEGAFSAAFVPVFSEAMEKRGRAAAWGTATRVVSVLAVVLVGVFLAVSAVCLAATLFITGETSLMAARLVPWLMPYAIAVCLCAAFGGMLQVAGRFAVAAFSQVLINGLLIAAAVACLVLGRDRGAAPLAFLVAAVLAAGVLQVGWHVWACRREGWRPRFAPGLDDPAVRQVGRLMAPVLIGQGIIQLNTVLDRVISLWLGHVAVTSLYYSQRIIYLPIGLFAVSGSAVCLPEMSRAWAAHDRDGMLQVLHGTLRHVLFLALPAFALMAVLHVPIVRLLFQYRTFTAADTVETAWPLLLYLPGIPAFAALKVITTAFHARKDTRTPVIVAIVCMVLNLTLNLILMQSLRQGGLALATTVSSYVNVVCLLVLLRRQLGNLGFGAALPGLLKPALAALAAAAAALAVHGALPWAGATLPGRLAEVMVPGLAGGVIYLALARALRCEDLDHIRRVLLRRLGRGPSGGGAT